MVEPEQFGELGNVDRLASVNDVPKDGVTRRVTERSCLLLQRNHRPTLGLNSVWSLTSVTEWSGDPVTTLALVTPFTTRSITRHGELISCERLSCQPNAEPTLRGISASGPGARPSRPAHRERWLLLSRSV